MRDLHQDPDEAVDRQASPINEADPDATEGRDHVHTSQPGHADTGSAAGVGGVTGAAIGSFAGPLGAAVGAAGGMLIGALAERAMHTDDDARADTAPDAEA